MTEVKDPTSVEKEEAKRPKWLEDDAVVFKTDFAMLLQLTKMVKRL